MMPLHVRLIGAWAKWILSTQVLILLKAGGAVGQERHGDLVRSAIILHVLVCALVRMVSGSLIEACILQQPCGR